MQAQQNEIRMTFDFRALIQKPRATDTGLMVAFVIACLVLLAFMVLASQVAGGGTLAFDRALIEGLRHTTDPAVPAGPPWLQRVMVDVTALGGGTVLTIITAIVVVYLIVIDKGSTAIFVAIVIAGGGAANEFLKSMFGRARPDLVAHLTEAYSSSFPSGHDMNSALTYLTLAALLARTQKDRRVRVFLLLVAILLTLAVGFSRVYLGVHWPTDVIAGWCVGATWALIFSLIAHALQRRNQIERPDAPAEGAS